MADLQPYVSLAGMKQSVVYFPPGAPDGEGGTALSDPVLALCRWETRNELFLDATGEEQTSEAIAYVNTIIQEGGHLRLVDSGDADEIQRAADLNDPAKVEASRARAREIRRLNVSPSLDQTRALYKAII